MTRPELNTAINTIFDDARANDSLSPSMEGNVIKLVADYIDQQAALKVDKAAGKSLLSDTEIARLAGISNAGVTYIESAFKVQQNGASAPAIYNMFVDQIQISPSDNSNPLFRVFEFTRIANGQFKFKILWFTGSASAVSLNKVDLSVADGNIKFTSLGFGSSSPYSWVEFNINAYNASGALSDEELYTNFYVKIFN